MFSKATKKKAKLRMALIGVSGAGKTYTAMKIASYLSATGKIAVADTEHGSASKYADLFNFDVCELTQYSPANYIEVIEQAAQAGYEVLIIDSFSHAWFGEGGALDMVNKETIKSKSNNSYFAWGKVTPLQNKLIDAIIAAPMHVICTMRAKQEYVLEIGKDGKTAPRKVGIGAIQRDGTEYEFDIVAEMDIENNLIITKSRLDKLSGKVFAKPGKEIADTIKNWLDEGEIEESPQSKGERVKQSRERLELTTDEVVSILESNFGVKNPSKLSSIEVDKLIKLMTEYSELKNSKQDLETVYDNF